MERCQIDLVFFEKKPSKDENGNINMNINIDINMVLVVLTFFLRYIFLRRLKSRDTIEEDNQLKEIFMHLAVQKLFNVTRVQSSKVYYPLFIAYICQQDNNYVHILPSCFMFN